MPEIIERRGQLKLFEGTQEAEAFHSTHSRGFFSVNWRNDATRKQAEEVQLLLRDIKSYESGDFGLAHAMRSAPGVTSVDERISMLKADAQGRSPMAVKQRCYPIAQLPVVLDALTRSTHFSSTDYWISQNGFSQPNRRATNVQSINMLFADLDIRAMQHELMHLKPDAAAAVAVQVIEDSGLPLPSFVLWSGNGLHLKWLLQDAAPRAAKPVWDALELHLVQKLKAAGLPVDEQVRDVSRILRVAGTYNQKGGELVHVVWINGSTLESCFRHDFNDLADGKSIMPWSRPEAREFKALGRVWDANRAIQRSIADLCKPNESVRRYLAADMWHARLSAIRRLVDMRYGGAGAPNGERNQYVWLAANALAWSASSADDYFKDLQPVIKEIAPSMKHAEVLSSASSVSRRVKEEAGKDSGLYKMTNATFNKLLNISDDEARALFSSTARAERNSGAMGFEKMQNLPFSAYQAETKRRQAEGGRYAAQKRSTTKAEDVKQKAREMRGAGVKLTEIANVLGVSLGSVHAWTK